MTESVASRCVIMNDLNSNPPALNPEEFTIPGYDLVGEIGSGGMGRVVLGRCQRTGEQVAIKLLASAHADATHEAKLRFQREIRILERIRHRHVINIRGTGFHQGAPYLVMDYASGGNLRQRMESGREFSRTELRDILSEVIQALAAMEQAGVVHRDLKPENVLLDEQGAIKIADFGVASVETELGMLTRTVQVLGTYDYMSPEQRSRLPVDSRADQYALAVITYELFAGKRPLGAFKPVSQLNPQFHPAVDAVLERALREDPDERFPDFAAFHAALDAASTTPRRLPRNAYTRMLATVAILISLASFLMVRSRRVSDLELVTSPLSADRSLVATLPAVAPPTEFSPEVPNQSAAEMVGPTVRDTPTEPGRAALRDPLATATSLSDIPLFDPAQALKLKSEIERLLDAGVRSLESQDLRRAEDFFQEALGKDPTDPRCHERMAL
ncbi:MAG: serine/threonine-protein kinase, partial [Planctomycetota bacterium]|nr:serine/threonine-protein kinase [Planctomycetota bacterium]